jgi:aspartate aminotransferase
MDYPLYIEQLGMTPVLVPVTRELRLDLAAIEAALTPHTRGVVLSQPVNPTGVVYSSGELTTLAAILQSRPEPPLLVSDECHRDVSAVEIPSPVELYDSTCVIYSFGKAFFMQGQRIGYVATSPRMRDAREFATLLERLARMMGFCTPTALMQIAVRQLIDFTPDFSAIDRRRQQVVSALRQAGFEVVAPDATFFVYPRCLDLDDFSFIERLAERGVLALPAALFHHAGHFRLSLTASDAMFDSALDVLVSSTVPATRH